MSASIISKFNRRYRHCLQDLLQVYADVDPDTAELQRIRLKEVDFEQLTIGFHHKAVEFEILKPIRYPDDKVCKNWDQVDGILRQMCYTAANSRGYSPICLKKIVYPNSVGNWLLDLGVLLVILAHYHPDWVYTILFGRVPYFGLLQPYNDIILIATAVCHLCEAFFLLRPKLAYYRVPIDYRMEWYACSMLDGFASIRRFNAYVDSIQDKYFDFADDTESTEAPVVDSDNEF